MRAVSCARSLRSVNFIQAQHHTRNWISYLIEGIHYDYRVGNTTHIEYDLVWLSVNIKKKTWRNFAVSQSFSIILPLIFGRGRPLNWIESSCLNREKNSSFLLHSFWTTWIYVPSFCAFLAAWRRCKTTFLNTTAAASTALWISASPSPVLCCSKYEKNEIKWKTSTKFNICADFCEFFSLDALPHYPFCSMDDPCRLYYYPELPVLAHRSHCFCHWHCFWPSHRWVIYGTDYSRRILNPIADSVDYLLKLRMRNIKDFHLFPVFPVM